MSVAPPLAFTLYSRAACGLCDEMKAKLAARLHGVQGLRVDVIDVDSDPHLRARFGHKVPVLMLGGELVCHGRLDSEELAKALSFSR